MFYLFYNTTTMITPDSTTAILDAADILFVKKGYGYVSLEEISSEANIKETELRQQFPNEALICTAWLEKKHVNSDKVHNAILMENKPACQKVQDYFTSLADYMKANQFRGCPFSNTAAGMSREERDSELQKIITEHKNSLREFLLALAVDINPDKSDVLGDSLFLLYSGATTESRNMGTLDPIFSAQKAAEALCDVYS